MGLAALGAPLALPAPSCGEYVTSLSFNRSQLPFTKDLLLARHAWVQASSQALFTRLTTVGPTAPSLMDGRPANEWVRAEV